RLHGAEVLHREGHLPAGERYHLRAAAFEWDMCGLDAGCRLEPFGTHVQRSARSCGAVVQVGGFLRGVDELTDRLRAALLRADRQEDRQVRETSHRPQLFGGVIWQVREQR